MFFDTKAAAISARQTHLSTFRKHLKSSVFTTLVVAALSSGAQAQTVGKYYNADGSRTDNLEAAAATWRNDPEFKLGWGAAAMKAEYAYALGITGHDNKANERVKIGIMDSGFLNTHSEFSPTSRFTPVIATGVSGNFIQGTNDGHGTKVTGVIGAARNGTGIEGVAFDADLFIGNTNATDGLLFGAKPSSGNSYLASVYDAIAAKNVRLISNSWGSKPDDQNYSTLPNLFAAYRQHDGTNTWIDGAVRASASKDGKEGIINNFSAGNNGYDNASLRGSLPYFQPELEGHWMTTTGFNSNRTSQIYNRCGIAKYWCIMAPTIVDTTDEFGNIASGFNGTSAAAPHASAALALIMQRYPYMTNEQALMVLFTTAQNKIAATATGPTTSTRSTTAIVDGTEKVPNVVTGWGLVDLQKGMNGPGQFFGAFNVSMSKGQDDTWSNDISQEAILQRQQDDKTEHDAWLTYKISKGWNNGLPAGASDADTSEFTYKTAREAAYQARQYIGSLSKSGAGKLSLTGRNTYSGDTLINGGELNIGLGGSIVSASVINDTGLLSVDGTAASATVNSGGQLKVNLTGITGDVTLNGGWPPSMAKAARRLSTEWSPATERSNVGASSAAMARSPRSMPIMAAWSRPVIPSAPCTSAAT